MSDNRTSRREFARLVGKVAMAGGLLAGYGTCAALGARFLYPARPPLRAWQYVNRLEAIPLGAALPYQSPGGAPINIARRGPGADARDFIALSSSCPHLGCQVHWEPHNERFFCPCHNGVFTPDGVAIAGPPAEAGQNLPQYPLRVEAGLLYIQVPLQDVSARGSDALDGAGDAHASCEGEPGDAAPRSVRRADREG